MAKDYSPFAGEMRERVTVQQETNVDDGAGGSTTSWTSLTTVWARVKALSSTTRIMAKEQAMSISHRVTIRYIDYLAIPSTSRYRLLWNTSAGPVEMRISGTTNPDALKRFIDIECMMGQMVAA